MFRPCFSYFLQTSVVFWACLVGSTESFAFEQPSWFPKESCKEVWKKKRGRPYLFDYEKFGQHEGDQQGQRYQKYIKAALEKNSTSRSKCYKKWTILVAMDANNDLMAYSLWDLFEMESSFRGRGKSNGSTLKKDVIVQHHGTDNLIRRLHMFESNRAYEPEITKRAFVDRGRYSNFESVQSPVIEVFNPTTLNSKKKRFSSFLEWGIREYPAEHYMVIYWGHGKGWMIQDESGKAHLSGEELRDALKEIQESEDGLQGKKRIDNFVADACYMQSLELISEIGDSVRYVSGSAHVQTYLGLPYRALFWEIDKSYPGLRKKSKHLPEELRLKPGDFHYEPTLVGRLLPVLMARNLNPNSKSSYGGRIDRAALQDGLNQLGNAERFTFGTLDVLELQRGLIPKLNLLGKELTEYITRKEELRSDRATQILNQIWSSTQFRSFHETLEFGEFIHRMKGLSNPIDELVDSIKRSLDKAIVHSLQGDKYGDREGFQSLNVWIPKRLRQYENAKSDFSALEGYTVKLNSSESLNFNIFGDFESGWHKFLQAVFEYAE